MTIVIIAGSDLLSLGFETNELFWVKVALVNGFIEAHTQCASVKETVKVKEAQASQRKREGSIKYLFCVHCK